MPICPEFKTLTDSFKNLVPDDLIQSEHILNGGYCHQFQLSNGCFLNFHRSNKEAPSRITAQGNTVIPEPMHATLFDFIERLEIQAFKREKLLAMIRPLMKTKEEITQAVLLRTRCDTRKKVPSFLETVPIGRTISTTPRKRRASSKRCQDMSAMHSSGWSQEISQVCEHIAFKHLIESLRFEVETRVRWVDDATVCFERCDDGTPLRTLIWLNQKEEQYNSWDIELRAPDQERPIHYFEVKSETPGLTECELAMWHTHGDQGFTALRVIPHTQQVTQEIIGG